MKVRWHDTDDPAAHALDGEIAVEHVFAAADALRKRVAHEHDTFSALHRVGFGKPASACR